MIDPNAILIFAAAPLAGLAMVVVGGLAGWRGWLALRRTELAQMQPAATSPAAGARIEIADLKERIRKLEAIAAGVEL